MPTQATATIRVSVDDVPKHERVAQALEQINGLRYRYKGAAASKKPKKSIDDDSDEGERFTDEDDDDEDDDGDGRERAEAKTGGHSKTKNNSSAAAAMMELTLDDHIERMLLRTRTIALLKIANNTAQVLPDDDDDDEGDGEDGDGDYGPYDEDNENENYYSGRADDDADADEKSDRFDGESPPESHASSMRRIGSTRRPHSFRTTSSFRSSTGGGVGAGVGGSDASDAETIAALRLVRKLSTFLSLPKVISYKDLEEITESLLDEPHDESEEYAHLIDEHIDSARDSSSAGGDGDGDSSVTGEGNYHHHTNNTSGSSRVLSYTRMTSQKSLRELNIVEDPHDLDLQQRRLYVENAGLRRYSSKKLIGASNRNLLLHGASQHGLGSLGSMRQLGGGASPHVSSHDLMAHKESKRSLGRGESWQSTGLGLGGVGSGGAAGSISSLPEEADGKDAEDGGGVTSGEEGGGFLTNGVLGTTFDEHGYKQWRTEIKDDYLAWIRAKVEAKKQRRLQKQKDAERVPRWLLLYQAANKGHQRHGSDAEVVLAERKQSLSAVQPRTERTSGGGRKSVI